MIRFLVVEDDPNKRARVFSLLDSTYPGSKIDVAASLIGGLRAAIATRPDVVILDMTLPNYDNEGAAGMHAFGGEEFIRQIRRKHLSPKIIVFTQFETFGDGVAMKDRQELERSLRTDFPDLYVGLVYYNAAISGWTELLLSKISAALDQSD